MGLRRCATGFVAVVVFGAVLTGCHSKVHAGAAGTALRDGLTVAKNTRLAGAVFDNPDNETWRATLDIDRDPIGVYDAYVAQARRLGMPLPGSGTDRASCPAASGVTTTVTTPCDPTPTCAVVRATLICFGLAARPSGRPLGIIVGVVWGPETKHVSLAVSHGADATLTFDQPDAGTDRLQLTKVPAAHAPRPVSVAGSAFGAENNSFVTGPGRFTLVEGSRVVSDGRDDFIVILEITGDAKQVLERYARQLASPPEDPPSPVESKRVPGGTVLTMSYSPFGGGSAQFTTDVSHRFVELTYSGD